MKNVSFAILGLIVVILGLFIFAKAYKNTGDTIIPSPVSVESPQLTLLPQASKSAETVPFEILKKEEISGKEVKISTAKGDIEIELFEGAPVASSNFLSLVAKGFYDGLTFHRVEPGFVVQGGDPKGDGTGGPGYSFADEQISRDYKRGTLAMANAGPNTNGSQFFICLQDLSTLPKQYTIFGNVTKGMDVVDKIAVGDKMQRVAVF